MTNSWRKLLVTSALVLGLTSCADAGIRLHGGGTVSGGGGSTGVTSFDRIPVGAGGYMTLIEAANDGTKVTQSDVYGAYVATNAAPVWRQCITTASIPSPTNSVVDAGPYATAIAPNDSQRIALIYHGILFISYNQCGSFVATTLTTRVGSVGGNGGPPGMFDNRLNGHHLDFDPQNHDVLYVCLPEEGCYRSINAGAGASMTFTHLDTIPLSDSVCSGCAEYTTNGTTASGNAVLHFASVSAADQTNIIGAKVVDVTNPTALLAGATVVSATSTTVTINNGARPLGVASGDIIRFGGGNAAGQQIAEGLGLYGYSLAVDGSSTLTSTRSSKAYILASGTGVYNTTDGGGVWSLTSGGPTTYAHSVMDKDGTYYVLDSAAHTKDHTHLWKFVTSTWTDQGEVQRFGQTLAADPSTSGRLVLVDSGGFMSVSLSHGDSGTFYTPGSGTQSFADVPWLGLTPNGISSGDLAFDPSGTNKLYLSNGISTQWTNPPATAVTFNWTDQSAGIENLAVNGILSTDAYPNPYMFSWDRPVFYSTDVTSLTAAVQLDNLVTIIMGWAADYAGNSHGTVCFLINWDGPTWVDHSGCTVAANNNPVAYTQFATKPTMVELATNSANSSGDTVLHFNSVPTSLLAAPTGNNAGEQLRQALYVGLSFNTSAPTVAGSHDLTFATTPANVQVGDVIDDPSNGLATVFFSVQSITPGTPATITMDGAARTNIASGEQIVFRRNASVIDPNFNIAAVTSTSVTLGAPLSAAMPTNTIVRFVTGKGGALAVSSPTNILWSGSNNEPWMWYTKDGGATWKNSVICATYAGTTPQTCASNYPGFNSDGSYIVDPGTGTGNAFAYFEQRNGIAADRVNANTFYQLNGRCPRGCGTDMGGGFYRSTDGGDTWVRMYGGGVTDNRLAGDTGGGAEVRAVDGFASHVLITGGIGSAGQILRTCDGGATWTTLNGISSVVTFGLGKAKPGGTGYPVVYAVGTVGGISAVWRAEDLTTSCSATANWIQVSTDAFPSTWLQLINMIDGDKNTYGNFYITQNASGWLKGTLH